MSTTSPPNRVRDFTSDPANNSTFGTLDIRRTVVNNTGSSVSRLRFRIMDLTTLSAPPGIADLRPRSSNAVVVTVDRAPCGSGTSNVTAEGTTLEQSASQPIGGGYNSSLSAGTVTLATPLANGAGIDVRFLLGVQQTGNFKFFVNVEAVTDGLPPPPASGDETPTTPSTKVRRLITEGQSPTARQTAPQPQAAPQTRGMWLYVPQPAWTMREVEPEPEKAPASKKRRARKAKDASDKGASEDEDGPEELGEPLIL